MQDFRKIIVVDGKIVSIDDKLFPDYEVERAAAILKALDGMKIVTAQLLLDHVKEALLQMEVRGDGTNKRFYDGR